METTTNFEIEEVEQQPGTSSKNDVAGDLDVPIEENLEENIEVENDAATFDIEETGTPNDDLEVPFEENLEVENATTNALPLSLPLY